MDSVRGLHFVSNLNALVSASEDCTLKVWDMHRISENDIEPYVTLRGHIGQIMTLCGTDNLHTTQQNTVFSGSING